jgi:hypothetical protein
VRVVGEKGGYARGVYSKFLGDIRLFKKLVYFSGPFLLYPTLECQYAVYIDTKLKIRAVYRKR